MSHGPGYLSVNATEYLKTSGVGTKEEPFKLVVDAALQDQTTPILIVPANKVSNTTTLTTTIAKGDMTIDVDTTTGFVAGVFIVLANATENRYMTARQVGAIAGSTVTLDTPVDFEYPAGTQITNGSTNLGVNGAVTTQVFSLRASDPGLPLIVDITRMIFTCTTATAVDMSTFGDLAALTNGLVLRRVDGTYNNIFNVKTNGEIASLMYDFQVYDATNPQQGQDGFVSRLTFAGQNKIGVTLRIGPDEDVELLIQDDLSGLTDFTVMFEGHVVDED